MGILFAFIAGIMIHISLYELLPEVKNYNHKKMSSILQTCYKIGFSGNNVHRHEDGRKKKDRNLQGWKNSRTFETQLTI